MGEEVGGLMVSLTSTFEEHGLTIGMMAFCALIFAGELAGSTLYGERWTSELFNTLGFSLQGMADGKLWTPITSLFIHATPDHLALNMIALFFFGRAVEESLHRKKFLLIFFASGLAGEGAIILASMFGLMPAAIPTVGASAAIFGLMAAAVFARPLEFVLYPYLIPLPMVVVAVFYTLYNVLAFLAVLAGGATDVAYVSHFGGLAAGALLGLRFEGMKRGLAVLALIVAILVAIPLLWGLVQSLGMVSYVSAFR